MVQRYYFFNVDHYSRMPDFLSNWSPHPRQFSRHFTKKATDSVLISWIFVNLNNCRLKKSIIALVPPFGTKNPILGVLAHGLIKLHRLAPFGKIFYCKPFVLTSRFSTNRRLALNMYFLISRYDLHNCAVAI